MTASQYIHSTKSKNHISSPSRNSHLIFYKRLLVSSLNIWTGPGRFHTMPLNKTVGAHRTKEKGLGWASNHSHTGALCPELVCQELLGEILHYPHVTLSPLPGFASEFVASQISWWRGNAPFSTAGFLNLERLHTGDSFFFCRTLA